MKNKGFTLIELLAVIVILAIIALIATPIILGIINEARDEAKERTAELIANGVELAYTSYMFDGHTTATPASFCQYMTTEYFEMDSASLSATCDIAATAADTGKLVKVLNGTSNYYWVQYANGEAKVYEVNGEETAPGADATALATVKLGTVETQTQG